MKRVCIKDSFIFKIEEQKYGLIQVIGKSVAGYWVRIFYDLLNDDCYNRIDEIIQSRRFYYINNFSEYELINKSYKFIGKYNIPSFVCIPRFTRASERKLNGKICWYIFDKKKGQVINQLNQFDERLKELSPEQAWGIEYIKRRWKENFTLEQWDDNLENKWYYNYLILYEPEKLKKIQLSNSELKKNNPSKSWTIFDDDLKDVLMINQCLEYFIDNVNEDNIEILMKQTILALNKINETQFIIDTVKAEDILSFLNLIVISKNINFDDTIIDVNRKW